MPFIAQGRRPIIDEMGLAGLSEIQPGDRCYVYYKPMVERWRANRRWTTAHEIYRDLPYPEDADDAAALDLAWQVFFQIHVMQYELEKRGQNGDI